MTPMDFHWPMPPFYVPADEGASTSSRECGISMLDRPDVRGELDQFDPGNGVIAIKYTKLGTPEFIPMNKVRVVTMSQPLALRPDNATIEGVGGIISKVTANKSFRVHFKDGSSFSGNTQGFVKEASGLFLFPIDISSGATMSCFIPAEALKVVNIGPLLGEALAEGKMVHTSTIATALDTQAALRAEPLGEFLRRRAIVSPEDLDKAIKEQVHRPNVRLGQVLMEAKLITQYQLDQALLAQRSNRTQPLGEILINMGAVSRNQIQEALAIKLGIPFIDVRDFKVNPEALKLTQASFAKQHQMLPLLCTSTMLVIAVENPLAIDFTRELRFSTGLSVVPVMATAIDLRDRIVKEYSSPNSQNNAFLFDMAKDNSLERSSNSTARAHAELNLIEMHDLAGQLSREAPKSTDSIQFEGASARVNESTMVRVVNKMIMDAHAQGASDIHIEANPGNRNLLIRFRKDGQLTDYLELESTNRSALVSRIKIMSDLDISERRQAQDGKIDFSRHGGMAIELRVAVIPTTNNLEDIVLRILAGAEPLPMEKLGLSAYNLSELKKTVARSYGLVLVCGPTGSGKTTTLHSMLRHINQSNTKIWTAEDPIEITQPGLRQVQVNAKIGWTFAAAMRAFLRADPDVIMVGEMRDVETAKTGVEASLTGHLVFSTLHTNSAAESITRLLDLGMDPFNFADALIGILSQRLVRKLCVKCKQPHAVSDKEIEELAQEYCTGTEQEPAATVRAWRETFEAEGSPLQLYVVNAKGCPDCNAGYKGRVGLHELLVTSPRVKQLIHERATAVQIAEAGMANGMTLLRQDGIEKVLKGEIDLASARGAFN
jgi:type II secretory ATPase GspE/PulE/Tfp pilus assembly ATPase PilB-like protein